MYIDKDQATMWQQMIKMVNWTFSVIKGEHGTLYIIQHLKQTLLILKDYTNPALMGIIYYLR